MKKFFTFQYLKLCVLTFGVLASFKSYAQPANDNPCNATPLTVGNSCNYLPYTTVGATASTGVPAPGCASYGGPDVWFSLVVPASGAIILDSQVGSITDGGMAVYSGTCTSMTLIECDDDDSPNGAMSYIYLSNQTPGATLFVRFWKYSSGTGTFSICASTPTPAPPCGASPPAGNTCALATPICDLNGYCGNTSASYTANSWTQLTSTFCGSLENNSFLSFVASSSSISFDVWVNSSTLGYGIQILIFSATNCSGTVTQYGPCYNPGSVPQGNVTITATGLTPGNTYYIMIDGNAGDVCNYTIGANSGVSIPVSINPVSSTICQGESVTLSASGGNGTYTWDASSDLNTTSGATVTATPPSAGTYNYTVNSATGNPLCPSSTSATATINVNPCGCVVSATNSGNVCAGTSIISLFATTISGASYSWSGPNGFTSTSQNPTLVPIPSTPGNYDYTVTVTENGTTCTSTTTVTVMALPAVDAGLPIAACQGGSVILSGSGAQSYTWNNGVTNGVSFIPASTTTYTVTGTGANGCQSTDQVTVTVNSLPNVDAGTSVTTCQGGSVTLSGSGAQSYTWNNGVTNGVSFIPSSTTSYTVIGTDANGCQNSDQVTVTVNPLPNVSAGSPQTVCQGGSVTLSGSGAQSYTWNNGVTNGVSFIPASTTTYTVTGTGANGCQSTNQVTVTVNSLPNVDAGSPVAVCQGGSVTLNGSGAQSYSWNNGVTNGISFTPSSTTTYTVTGTGANGCQSTDQVTVTVNPLPNVSAGNDQSVCIGSEITLSGSGAVSYSWNNGVSNGVSFTIQSTQTYVITGTDANGCVNTDELTITVVPIPVAEITSDVDSGFPTLTVNFDNHSINGSTYHWDFGNGVQQNVSNTAGQQMAYTTPGSYIVYLVAQNGSCTDSDTLLITVNPLPDPIVIIPNIFTPNADKSNDEFFLNVSYVKSVSVQIVNRWGEKMYSYDDVQGFWDGTVNGNPASEGVYFFTYVIEGINGSVSSGQGTVELIR